MDSKKVKAVIHCSDSPHGRGDDAATIHKWHKERGFDGVGYHYVILEDGTVQSGRPEFWSGAHAKGYNSALGICLIGERDFEMAQMIALEKLLKDRGFKANEVVGHYQIDERKTCPNFDVPKYLVAITL